MAVNRGDYGADAVTAAKSVMLELARLLGEYRDDIVIIGGWVPELLIAQEGEPHIGSTDVDLALNHLKLQAAGYRSIQDLLESRGYRQGHQPFVYYRDVSIEGEVITVHVDLLAGEYEGTGKGRRHQSVQDVKARKARGCELAFELNQEVPIEGALPGGAKDSARVRVASIVPFLVMKGMALADRLKEKDAWDLCYCMRNYPGGIEAIAAEFGPYVDHGLVKEGLSKIADKFASIDHVGPTFVADFEEVDDPEERESIKRDAYERVNHLLDLLRHSPP
jgi:hypothetical protein